MVPIDPIAAAKLLCQTISSLYSLRLSLKTSQDFLTSIQSEITNLQLSIDVLHRLTKSRILSQENFDNLAISYEIYKRNIMEIEHILGVYSGGRGIRLVWSLRFQFGPRAELGRGLVALDRSVQYLVQRYERFASLLLTAHAVGYLSFY
jgi:hypothetical protein